MRRSILLLTTLLASSGFIPSAWAADNPAPIALGTRLGVHDTFDRLVFDWPKTVTYKLLHEGTTVTLTFAAPADLKPIGALLQKTKRFNNFSSTTDPSGQLIVRFSVNPQASVRAFTNGSAIAVDVTGNQVLAPLESKQDFKDEPKPPAQPKEQPSEKTTPNKEQELPIPLIPPRTEKTVSDAKPHLPPPTPTATTAATTPPPPSSPLPAANTAHKDETVAAHEATTPAPTLAVALPDTPTLVASLDPQIPTRVAIYQRAGYGYIIFDRVITASLAHLSEGYDAPTVRMNTLSLDRASGYRFPIPEGADIRAVLEATCWKIYISAHKPDIPVSLRLIAQPDFALGARILLPLVDAPQPIRVTDPVVGDDLIVVPMLQNQAASIPRRFAEFDIVPAAIGLVIRPTGDGVVARIVSDGIEISAEGGLQLSPSTDTGLDETRSGPGKGKERFNSLFDFTLWKGKKGEKFTRARQRLQQNIVDVPEGERNRARLELARFYFAYGFGQESYALLNILAKEMPDLVSHKDFLALLGASAVLANRLDEGQAYLASPLFEGLQEIELWQAVASAYARNWLDADEKFSVTRNLLQQYPEPFRSRFFVLALESTISSGHYASADEWMEKFDTDKLSTTVKPAIAYVSGALHAKAGRAQAAADAWKSVTRMKDRLYKIRAELALVDLGVATHSLSPAQAAARLEALRFAWRGDDLEIDILHRLGEFYVEANDVRSGLSTLSTIMRLYPNSPHSATVHAEMAQIFHDVFLGNLGKGLSPLDALSIYQQYSAFMPAGREGDDVLNNLAERLVAIDLLDQAASLLETMIQQRLNGEEKARTSVRLAAIRLLDHKPDDALTALDMGKVDAMPQDIALERTLLRARALAQAHRDDDALSTLATLSEQNALILRADILMRARRWPDAAKTLMDLVGPPPAKGTSLTQAQISWLVTAAVAWSLTSDQTNLDNLAVHYGAAMAETSQKDVFRVLTKPQDAMTLTDIGSIQTRLSEVDLFQGFMNQYRTPRSESSPSTEEKRP